MADIGPGTLVRCVRDDWRTELLRGETAPRKGIVYTVRDVISSDADGFLLVEIVNRPLLYKDGFMEAAWDVRAFVPLDPRRLDIFRTTSTDTPAKEPVAA